MHPLTASALAALTRIEHELTSDETRQSYIRKLDHVEDRGQEDTTKLLAAVRRQSQNYGNDLSGLCSLSYKNMKATRNDHVHCLLWRSLYADSALVWSLLDILREHNTGKDEAYWKAVVERLDNAIIIAGAPGEGRLDMILDTIEAIQNAHLPLAPASPQVIIPPPTKEDPKDSILLPSATTPVPVLPRPPSISAFRSNFRNAPFILRRFADDWPAVSERRWAYKAYLQNVAGRGRVVPIEIGRDYRTDDWTQRMIEWDEFLDYLFDDIEAERDVDGQGSKEVRYLAQHDLFKQFPRLREDTVVPDYVYACLSPPEHYPQYRPPANEEELVMNIWIGPRGALSPAHIDPFYNFYTQVVGRKAVWLAPPSATHILSPGALNDDNLDTSASLPERGSSSEARPSKGDASSVMLSNTTHLDVFASAAELQREREFLETVVPVAMSAVLDEGDMLFFPPGWWHAFRSESTSFSVSMWF